MSEIVGAYAHEVRECMHEGRACASACVQERVSAAVRERADKLILEGLTN